ncbi:uncharacterized protein LOC122091564 [Macadamia integrifolia]|uniref:uncharacterized protein LOC122091564 n=1 Tax=Macadamia integrifolia TaxID=60698 RepID=UPI001C4FD1A6|nr:uncharacterized protein LOC122091564 [Macadamia integrifolia]
MEIDMEPASMRNTCKVDESSMLNNVDMADGEDSNRLIGDLIPKSFKEIEDLEDSVISSDEETKLNHNEEVIDQVEFNHNMEVTCQIDNIKGTHLDFSKEASVSNDDGGSTVFRNLTHPIVRSFLQKSHRMKSVTYFLRS